jgi:hypothetical protein
MAVRMRGGKISELEVATECIKHGLSVFWPFVDDENIDMVVRLKGGKHYYIQVKSVRHYRTGLPPRVITTRCLSITSNCFTSANSRC